MVIGITGKSGSGKSTLCKNICKYTNFVHIDVNDIAYEVLNEPEIKKEVEKRYGFSFKKTSKVVTLDIVFNSRKIMKETYSIIYDKITERVNTIIDNNENVIIDYMYLPEYPFFKRCDIKILMTALISIRSERVIEKDNISYNYFMIREKNSIDYIDENYTYIINSINHNKKDEDLNNKI